MKIDEDGFDELGRPCWDLYLMSLAFNVAQRSLDPNTKCGCVFVDNDNAILTTGYNSPPKNCDDATIPLNRPAKPGDISKYDFFSHAEESAISIAAKRGISLLNAKAYITGTPCHFCLRKMINSGIIEITISKNEALCVDENSKYISKLLLSGNQIKFKNFQYNKGLYILNHRYKEYLEYKKV